MEVSHTQEFAGKLNRRQFLKELGLIVAGGGLTAACQSILLPPVTVEEQNIFDPENPEDKRLLEIFNQVMDNGFAYMNKKVDEANKLLEKIKKAKDSGQQDSQDQKYF